MADEDSQDEAAQQTDEKKLVKKAKLPPPPEEENQALATLWTEKTDVIRKTVAPNLNRDEFLMFVGMGKMLGANPFKKEIYPARFGGQVQTIVARDFYRRKAQEQPSYEGHRAIAIYENDEFSLVNGGPHHEVNSFADRGDLVGAYAIGWRSDVEEHFYVDVRLDEYDQGNYMWKTKADTMIKKVAEAHLLRLMYQGILGNTYIPDEVPRNNGGEVRGRNRVKRGSESTEEIIIEADE